METTIANTATPQFVSQYNTFTDANGEQYTKDSLLTGIVNTTKVSGGNGAFPDGGGGELDPGLFTRNPKGWNIQAACQWLHSHAAAGSSGWCARYVRQAIEAGGLSTAGRPNWAWKYIHYLPTIGFKFIGTVSRNQPFTPQPGDIAVYQKGTNPNVPGHICMWTGMEWASDFRQRNMIVYQATNTAYLFRFAA